MTFLLIIKYSYLYFHRATNKFDSHKLEHKKTEKSFLNVHRKKKLLPLLIKIDYC